MADEMMQKLGNLIKTWLPIAISIGGLITGYFVFKAEVRHQFEMQKVQIEAMQLHIQTLDEEIDENRRDWQRQIELQLQELREVDIRNDLRIKVLENRPLD